MRAAFRAEKTRKNPVEIDHTPNESLATHRGEERAKFKKLAREEKND